MGVMADAERMSATKDSRDWSASPRWPAPRSPAATPPPWVTDFLNAAYYRRAAEEREVDDLRFAFSVLTTYWYRKDPAAGCA